MKKNRTLKDELIFEFTQNRYVSLEGIKYRCDQKGVSLSNWNTLKKEIQDYRKTGSERFYLKSIDKSFWYFPSKSIHKKIMKIDSFGNQISWDLKNYDLIKKGILKNSLIEESISSAIYEGANCTRAEARKLIASKASPQKKSQWMLYNNYKTMEYIKEHRNHEVSIDIVLKIHEIISKNTFKGDDENFYGKFRDDKVFVLSSLGKRVHEGAPYQKIETTLKEVFEELNIHSVYFHPLFRSIILHYLVAYIHPFFDGNGRVARALFYFQCMTDQHLDFVEFLSISADLKERGRKYTKSFELVKEHGGDMTYFIDYCLDSILRGLEAVDKKIKFVHSIQNLQSPFGLSNTQIKLLQEASLDKYFGVSIESYAKLVDKSREYARQELKDLLQKKFLKEKQAGKRFLYFIDKKFLKKSVAEVL